MFQISEGFGMSRIELFCHYSNKKLLGIQVANQKCTDTRDSASIHGTQQSDFFHQNLTEKGTYADSIGLSLE